MRRWLSNEKPARRGARAARDGGAGGAGAKLLGGAGATAALPRRRGDRRFATAPGVR